MGDQNRYFVDGHQHSKYRNFKAELKKVRAFLSDHNATATMTSIALDIYRPNLCRHKRTLEEQGTLIVTHKGTCKETGFKADYLTCNPELIKERENHG